MNAARFCALLLGAGVLWSSVHLLRHAFAGAAMAPRGLRLVALLLAQIACATLLYFTLFPPAMQAMRGTLVVLTAGADLAKRSGVSGGSRVVALPEAPRGARAERAPDLATALRRYPHHEGIQVVGAGLPARDIAAATGWPLRFDPAPLPRGMVELWSPHQVRRGSRWSLSGRVAELPGGRVELRDPADVVVARAALDGQGRFALQAGARAVGRTAFQLAVVDAQGKQIETIELPLAIVAGAPLRVLLLAGGVGPELKYLRRWATDAAVKLDSSMEVGPNVRIGDATAAPDAAALRALDLVVLDDRSWTRLGQAGRSTLTEALREGLGILLLLTGSPDAAALGDLRALGFALGDAEIPRTVTLGVAEPATPSVMPASATGEAAMGAATSTAVPELTRRPLRVASSDAAPLLRDGIGSALATWRAEGQGRIALWWLTDSYRLVLAGHPDLHGSIWSQAFTTLARSREVAVPQLRGAPPRLHQRLNLCRIAGDARVLDLAGMETPLLIDPAAGADNCAAYWPRVAGWHEVRSAAGSMPLHVRDIAEAPGLVAQSLRDATAQLAARPSAARATQAEAERGSPWRWFFGWLAASAALWWLERSRPRVPRNPA